MQRTPYTATKPDSQHQPSVLSRLLILIMAVYLVFVVAYSVLRLIFADQLWWVALLHNLAPYYFLPLVVVLPLALLLRARRLAGVALILAIVGGVWLVPRMLPAAPPDVPYGTEFDLITMNVYPHNERLDRVLDWLRVQDADVVLLQELDTEASPEFLAALEDRYPYQAFDTYNTLTHGILSKYEILERDEIDLQGYTHQRFTIDLDGDAVTLFNVHLLMPQAETAHIDLDVPPNLLWHYDETERNAQITQLLAMVGQEENPLIIAGDFNTSSYSPIYDTISAQLTDVYRYTSLGLGATWPSGASEELPDVLPPLMRLDYIWTTPQLAPLSSEVGPRLGSDHLPLLATLKLIEE
ncbi:endonuclease/exonuclease/phosphatase family protein [Phototrophicus methaneseepsis]|uniref:Endonuclease/exonuclease/phosphatase family protein n=1 Tax=Phototrophicus methaneseepsis TaxID=2710758 RepID=A0A7S8IG42_9CHLR|nr:endonuclease/exonuclease/phosphatase family protein [Phototrophicus methaneseepsis]QPC84301.1 endonuclease/exonuclease/phosphatase family protein [Phototrophicus methaneseepsis]